MRQKYVMANWKMHGSGQFAADFLNQFKEQYQQNSHRSVVIFPPAIYLQSLITNFPDFKFGAQNLYPKDSGAYTGELSSAMLKEAGCSYALVGHSERRHLFNENEKFIAKKFHHALLHDIIPVLCIGETLAERESGKTEAVIMHQLGSILEENNTAFKKAVVAYEPVWAIGTGKTANVQQIGTVHRFIREFVAKYDADVAQNLPLLYGGSVNEKNAEEIFNLTDVDGGLVGGASLDPLKFAEIVKCIN